jgi:predicted DNA-binding antitoxin AbrB/MazE fold protein
MVRTIEATFDGKVLRPDAPLELKPNTRVRVTIDTLGPGVGEHGSFLRTARSLKLEGPPDWAENLDSYLYDSKAQNHG